MPVFSNTNEDKYITFTNDSGKEMQFEFLDLINCNDEGYVVLLPPDSDGTVEILKITGDNECESEENEEILRRVFAIFKKTHPELEYN